MESLLGKAMEQSDENDGSKIGPTLIPSPEKAHGQLVQAMDKISPSQFHEATTSAMSSLSSDQRSSLSSALTDAGAAQGAGVQAGATDPNAISKMLHWVQTNVPGGIPAVLGAVGLAGGAAAVAESGQGGNLASAAQSAGSNAVQSAQNASGGLFHSVLGAIMPAINDAVSKAGK